MKATTGFADTTGVSGTLTDLGLILGQATNPANRNSRLWSKFKSLLTLIICLASGSFIGSMMLWFSDFTHVKKTKSIADHVVARALVAPGLLLLLLGFGGHYISETKLVDRSKLEEDVKSPADGSGSQGLGSNPVSNYMSSALDPEASHCLSPADGTQSQPLIKKESEKPKDVQKFVDEQKDAIVRTAFIAAFMTGAANYVVADIISPEVQGRADSVSHITGLVDRLGMGLADLMTNDDRIQLRGQDASNFVIPGLQTIAFWLMGATMSGFCTRYPRHRNYRTGAAILIVVGFSLFSLGISGGCNFPYMVPAFCFAFGLLNGTMSSTTGFARTGHFTGVLMNIGLLFGQLSNVENDKPEIWWKLKKSCHLLLWWASGIAIQSLICRVIGYRMIDASNGKLEKAEFKVAWVYIMIIGIAMMGTGSFRMYLRHKRMKAVTSQNVEDQPQQRNAVVLLDEMVFEEMQDLGAAGGFTFDAALYPHHNRAAIRHDGSFSVEMARFRTCAMVPEDCRRRSSAEFSASSSAPPPRTTALHEW